MSTLLTMMAVTILTFTFSGCSDDDDPVTEVTYTYGFSNMSASHPDFLEEMNKIEKGFQTALGITGKPFTKKGSVEECDKQVYEACRKAFDSLKSEGGKPLHTAIRYGATQAVLDALPATMVGWVAAGRYAEVEIDLFPESAKEVEIFFLNHGVNYEHREPRRNQPDAPEAILVFDWGDVPVKLRIYSPDVERLSRRSPHGARQMERARLATVEALIKQGPAESTETHP